jgi:hypothetical protein
MERWLPVVGYEGLYEVSDRGQVRSLDRTEEYVGRWGHSVIRQRRARMMRISFDAKGYHKVTFCQDGKEETCRVSRLVLTAFDQPCPPEMEACHGTLGKLIDWWPENIYWGTKETNSGADKRRDGTDNGGSRNSQARLTEDEVREIRRRYIAGGVTQLELAYAAGVSEPAIWKIVTYRTWKHVQ